MRPEKLELEGFTAFRDKTEITFDDTDLFVLVGPTGAGKSSIIDAMIFSLYGSIPRLRKGRVEPVISLGSPRARIRFTFSVDGVQYSATRVVQRTKTGATTAEARLEGGAEDIVGAAEVTEAVQSLLGLTYEHFIKSVVLPQGTFASFLLGGSSDRQALLRELLDLGRYARLRDLAVQRAQTSQVRAESLEEVLRQLTDVSSSAVEELEKRIESLDSVIEWAAGQRERLASLRTEHAEIQARTTACKQQAAVLESMEMPAGLTKLDRELATVRARREEAEAELDKATLAFEQAQESAAQVGDAGQVAKLLASLDQLERLDGKIATDEASMEALESAVVTAKSDVEAAEESTLAAEQHLLAVRTEHAAHAIRATLTVGDDCPVCRRVVDETHVTPDAVTESVIADAEKRAFEAAATRTQKHTEFVQKSAQLEQLRDGLRAIAEERSVIAALVSGHTREQLEADQQVINASRADVAAAAQALSGARATLDAAERSLRELTASTATHWSSLDRCRMATADLDPPEIDRKDLLTEWTEFLAWRDEQLESVKRRAAQSDDTLRKSSEQIALGETEISDRISRVGVKLQPGSDPYQQAVAGRAQLWERLARMVEDLARKVQAAAQIEGYQNDSTVARSLADHLKVNGFERWLIEEIVRDLVLHANERLEQLTSGSYALAVEKSEFVIIDRLNADERRAPETLSGGETFVVSLALALSLADQMASISMAGTARLESVFLDEGFGTLDSETLDTVASVIHELGADGRTVGLITHVRELALQIPTRFEVSKQAGTAVVKRVDT